VPRWPGRKILKHADNGVDRHLWVFQGCYRGALDERAEFERALAAVRELQTSGGLGPVGLQRELKRSPTSLRRTSEENSCRACSACGSIPTLCARN
jgi:hypothetical protein